MGISRDNWHKRRATGGKRCPPHKKEVRAGASSIGAKRIHLVRCRGGNIKHRALRLDFGTFSWGSEGCTRKTRIVDTVYNASNNELVRTKTLVKNSIITVDAVPFRQWYEAHYAVPLARKKEGARINKRRSKNAQAKYTERQKFAEVEPHLIEQFQSGRLLACISSRPGQVGRADGYILEGKELEFYLRKIRAKKAK
ncbi:40S ribosomal protein S8 [Dirofilaria immitis]|nr:40S ribosomal protein S8 [Dirofilaria immitis]